MNSTEWDKITGINPNSGFPPVHPLVTNYLNHLNQNDDPIRNQMEELAFKKNFPIVGPLVGSFLKVLTSLSGAKSIFEFGSGFGYSAYWFIKGMEPGGKIYCTDGDSNNQKLAESFLSEAKMWHQVIFKTGWAQNIFKETSGEFDIIYNDVDKNDYPEVWELAQTKIKPGGLYIADNTLWSSRVALENLDNDKYSQWTPAIKKHNDLISKNPNFDWFLNPIRDGVIVARKKR